MLKKIISILLCVIILFGLTSFFSSCSVKLGRSYYISSSTGNDANDAKTEKTAWKSFENLKDVVLQPGDKVLLKRGDEWNERLEIYGGGSTKCRALVSSYGDISKPKPIIRLNNTINDICVLVADVRYDENQQNMFNEISNLTIENLDVRNAYLGIYIRTLKYYCKNLTIQNCDISNIWAEEILETNSSGYKCVLNYSIPGSLGERYATMAKGNLPYWNRQTNEVLPTGGGAIGDEAWFLASAVLFTGGWTNVEIGNIVMNNNMNGLELIASKDIWVHDVIAAGSLTFRSQHCTNVTIERTRCLQTHQEITFWGGITGSYFGTTTNGIFKNSEISYVWRNGENDGCAIDYETQCWDCKIENNAFHHNDSGSLLIMELPATATHSNVTFNSNLCYDNIRDPKSGIYNWEVFMKNNGRDNISISYNDFFTPFRTKWGIPGYIGCNEDRFAATTIKDGNVEKDTDDYRTRFSFNKDGNTEGWKILNGSFTVANGIGKLTAKNKLAAMVLDIPVNGFCYKELLFKVTNNAKGMLQLQYANSDGTIIRTEKVAVNGAGEYSVSLGKDIYSVLKNVTVLFTPVEPNGSLELDYAQFILDMSASAKKSGTRTIDVTFTGESFPVISDYLQASYLTVNGYTVNKIEKINYNTVRVTVNKNVGNLSNLKITAKAELFIPYFADIIKGLDCDRTAADDAALLGCSAQSYYYNGSISLTCK